MYPATSSSGGSRRGNRPTNDASDAIRSTRNVRQSSADRSQHSRYQRRPVHANRTGSTTRRDTPPSAAAYSNPNASRSRHAVANRVNNADSTVGPPDANDTVADPTAFTLCRNRAGNTCSNFANARTDVSSIPVTVPAVRNPTATATASSSSSNNGGIAVPAANRYPPATPGGATTG